MEKNLLYVNEFLQVETSRKKQKAIVNEVAGMLEIAFLTPIAYKKKGETMPLVVKWCESKFPDYEKFRRYCFPHSETCLLQNKHDIEHRRRPRFRKCYTSTSQQDRYGHVGGWDTINEKGLCCRAMQPFNVYAAIIVTKEYFLSINPTVKLSEYDFTKGFVAL